jgi:hypothetical protein
MSLTMDILTLMSGLMKLDAHDRAQLVMIAYETRLVTPSS